MTETIKVWTHDPQAAEAALLAGEATEDVLTQYGANEFAVDFLRQSGIWQELLVKPKHGKDNGKDWKKIAGITILSELLHVGHLAQADKVIKDAKLMMELGFTFTEIESAKNKDKGVIHRDTIRNYFKAIPEEKSLSEYYSFVNFMRGKKWIRGKTCVADGFEIEVFGETYKGIGQVYDDKEKRWKYGYKAVILMNVEEARERIIGLAIGPINSDERKLLLKIFKDIEKHVDKIKNLMDVIILDRGYWGYDFLQKTIVGEYQIDYVVVAKKSFTFIKEDLRYLIDHRKLDFQERRLFNRSTKEWEDVKVAFARDICFGHFISKKNTHRGKINVVVMKQMGGKEAIEAMGERSFIGGQAIIVYTNKCFGTFSTRHYRELIKSSAGRIARAEVTQKLLENLKSYLPRSKIKEISQKLSG